MSAFAVKSETVFVTCHSCCAFCRALSGGVEWVPFLGHPFLSVMSTLLIIALSPPGHGQDFSRWVVYLVSMTLDSGCPPAVIVCLRAMYFWHKLWPLGLQLERDRVVPFLPWYVSVTANTS